MPILVALLVIACVISATVVGPWITLLGLALVAVEVVTLFWIKDVITMFRDRALHVWPSVTSCQLCDRRIFVWQRYERRRMAVTVEGAQHLPPTVIGIAAAGSAVVHRGCEGTPTGTVHVSSPRTTH